MSKYLSLAMLAVVAFAAAGTAAEPRMTAVTFFAAQPDGTVIEAERWNTIAPHPAWDVYIAPGVIPGQGPLNNVAGGGNRSIDWPLAVGTHTFTFAVSHLDDAAKGDLGFSHYGLNVFLNGNPSATTDEAPQLSGLVAADRNGPGAEPDHSANTAASTMGFPLAGKPGAGLMWSGGGYTVEMTDYFVYSKFDSAGAPNPPVFDVLDKGSNVGPFTPDGNQDVVGQFTLRVVPEPASAVLAVLGGLSLLGFRRRIG